MAKEDSVTISREQLDHLIQLAARGSHPPTQAEQKNEEQLYKEKLALEGISYEIPDRTPSEEWHVPCRNEDNGATFTARVVKSRTFPEGRVIDLLEYKYPDDIESRCKGLEIKNVKTGQPTIQFKQWRWTEYDQADRKAYVGKSAKKLPKVGDAIPVKFESFALRYAG